MFDVRTRTRQLLNGSRRTIIIRRNYLHYIKWLYRKCAHIDNKCCIPIPSNTYTCHSRKVMDPVPWPNGICMFTLLSQTHTHTHQSSYVYKKTYETHVQIMFMSYVQKYSQNPFTCLCVYTPIQISSFLNSPCEFQLPRKFNRFEKRHSNMAVHCSPAFEPKEARKKKWWSKDL